MIERRLLLFLHQHSYSSAQHRMMNCTTLGSVVDGSFGLDIHYTYTNHLLDAFGYHVRCIMIHISQVGIYSRA